MEPFIIYVWIICFWGLYLALFWINLSKIPEKPIITEGITLPHVTLVIPAYNEEDVIVKTISSVLKLDYPKNKLKLVVVNDGSKDRTQEIVEKVFEIYKRRGGGFKTLLINKTNAGKAAALNYVLKDIDTELFGVVDSDSLLEKNSLKEMICYFSDKEVGAVIHPIYVAQSRNFWERLQRLEYILTGFVRSLMAKISTVYVTPGVLSVYKTNVVKKIGGFDEHTITEDLEMALKLQYNKYKIVLEPNTKVYTYVPTNFKDFWRQRIRWYRGFIQNAIKYKKMFLNKRYGLMGIFQTPVNVIGMFIAWASVILFSYNIINLLYKKIVKLITLRGDIFYLNIPSVKELILKIDMRIAFPLVIGIFFMLYLFHKAHIFGKEKWKFHFITLIYMFIYPLFVGLQYLWSLILELIGVKRKW